MARNQQSIQTFGRISKATTDDGTSKKRKASPEPCDLAQDTVSIQRDRVKRVKIPRTPVDTPTKSISLKFARLELAQNPSTPNAQGRPLFRTGWTTFEDTPPTSPSPSYDADEQHEEKPSILPKEIGELKALNSALLSSLSLHYAHNGSGSPLDIRKLLPSVTRLWGKRNVILADVERCFGLLQSPKDGIRCPFQLFDYGQGLTYIELASQAANGFTGLPFNQNALLDRFDRRVEQTWLDWIKRASGSTPSEGEEDDMTSFINHVPRAVTLPSPTACKTAQALTHVKGQKRLRDLLDGRGNQSSEHGSGKKRRVGGEHDNGAAAKSNVVPNPAKEPLVSGPVEDTTLAPQVASAAAPAERGQSLLDRIRAKQMHAASLPAAPTKDQIARVAALRRVEDIVSILDMLVAQRAQGPRASFPLPSLTQSIQSSLRSPMSRDEIERCLGLMQNEVAAGYVKILRMGAVSGVVVDTSQKPRKDILKQRLTAAGV